MENWRDREESGKCCVSSTATDGGRFRERSKSAFGIERQNFSLRFRRFFATNQSIRLFSQSSDCSVPLRFGQAWRAPSRSHRAWGRVTA
jgi:hypothetical protein